MSVKGIRVVKNIGEPTLLRGVDDIIKYAKENGFVKKNEVDIEAIIMSKKINLLKEDLPSSVSGYLRKINNDWTIGVNKNHSKQRQRFTMAHEFAHFTLHRREGDYFEDVTFFRENLDSPIEYKANEFAAELLMPEDLVRAFIKNGITNIVTLANEFNVSVQAITFRAKNLGYNVKTNN